MVSTDKPGMASSIFKHARLGNSQQLQQELNSDLSKVHVPNDDGQTPLLVASMFRHADIVAWLLSKSADPNTQDLMRKTALQYACSEGHAAVAELLINAGAAIDAGYGKPSLHLAIQGWHREVTLLLLRHNASLTARSASDPYLGMKALHVAAESGDIEAVELLLQRGADVNILDDIGLTPVCHAAQLGHSHIVKALIDRGGWVNAPRISQVRPINPFMTIMDPDVTAASPLHLAAFGGHVDVAHLLLQQGAHVNHEDSEGATPLFAAARNDQEGARAGAGAVAALLLRNGARVDVTGGRFRPFPVLHQAAAAGNHVVVGQLLMHGAQVDARREESEWTALHDAAAGGHALAAQALLQHGAEVDARDEDGQTPLFWAAGGEADALRGEQADPKGGVECVRMLLAFGADVNAVDSKLGWAPLHAAAYHGKADVVQLLLQKGADRAAVDRKQKVPRQLASSQKHTEVARLLR
jgi:ankyrin repeat protein